MLLNSWILFRSRTLHTLHWKQTSTVVHNTQFRLNKKAIMTGNGKTDNIIKKEHPVDIFVQTLPVVVSPSGEKSSTNEEKMKYRMQEGRILLCKWNSGDFKDRYTGLIQPLIDKRLELYRKADSVEKQQTILLEAAKEIIPSRIKKFVTQVIPAGLLRFEDAPACDEYIYIAHLDPTVTGSTSSDENYAGSVSDSSVFPKLFFDKHPCFWFNWKKIPFKDMPADDEIWYPQVLWEEKKVKGSFTFGGKNEKTIKSFHLQTVEKIF